MLRVCVDWVRVLRHEIGKAQLDLLKRGEREICKITFKYSNLMQLMKVKECVTTKTTLTTIAKIHRTMKIISELQTIQED